MTEIVSTTQKEFDDAFITSTEIGKELGVCRTSIVNARKRGLLPQPIVINGAQIYIWKRGVVRPYLDAWKVMLQARRGQLV